MTYLSSWYYAIQLLIKKIANYIISSDLLKITIKAPNVSWSIKKIELPNKPNDKVDENNKNDESNKHVGITTRDPDKTSFKKQKGRALKLDVCSGQILLSPPTGTGAPVALDQPILESKPTLT